MKKNIFLFVCFMTFLNLYSQIPYSRHFGGFGMKEVNKYLFYPSTITFNNNTYSLEIDFMGSIPKQINTKNIKKIAGLNRYIENGNYLIDKINGIEFIKTSLGSLIDNKQILYSKYQILLSDSKQVIFESQIQGNAAEAIMRAVKIDVSSELTENGITYSGNNVNIDSSFKNPFLPWIESKPDNGIGESITITYKGYIPISGFYLSNGFVSFDKPELYESNSRVKRIKIEIDGTYSKEYFIEDFSNFQFLEIDHLFNKNDEGYYNCVVKFTIIDVYQGLKWSDTCINKIVPLSSYFTN